MEINLKEEFEKVFGDSEGVSEYFSPGRVNLIGEHTDYNGGHVFPCALTIGTYAAARKRDDDIMRFYSGNMADKGIVEVKLSDLVFKEENDWANYPLGVVWAFKDMKNKSIKHGFDMYVWGNIPNGSGLSSSASLEVLTGVVLCDLYGIDDLSMIDLALIGQHSENNFNGLTCGIMDQFAVAMGKKEKAIFLDTSDLSYEYADIALSDARIVITNSKVKHSLVSSAYNDRVRECKEALADLQTVCGIKTLGDLDEKTFEAAKSSIKDETNRQRAKHAVYENQRTIHAVDALKKGDITALGKLMNESHVSLRDDYEVSCDEIDVLVNLAWEVDGVIGSRITGGGFGGCTVSIVKNDAVEAFKEHVLSGYKDKCGLDAEIYVVDIGDGARKL